MGSMAARTRRPPCWVVHGPRRGSGGACLAWAACSAPPTAHTTRRGEALRPSNFRRRGAGGSTRSLVCGGVEGVGLRTAFSSASFLRSRAWPSRQRRNSDDCSSSCNSN